MPEPKIPKYSNGKALLKLTPWNQGIPAASRNNPGAVVPKITTRVNATRFPEAACRFSHQDIVEGKDDRSKTKMKEVKVEPFVERAGDEQHPDHFERYCANDKSVWPFM